MGPSEVEEAIKNWFASESIELQAHKNEKAHFHMLIKFPPGPTGHTFNISMPKNRNLVAISSGTRVDGGQQKNMKKMRSADKRAWRSWLHRIRMTLTQTGIDWVVHLGHENGVRGVGPLQAFNVSEPIWIDGLSQNELMQSLRRLWLAKLSIIHEIKFQFGPGSREQGPVDDWSKKGEIKKQGSSITDSQDNVVEGDESGGFGSGFDPSDWV